MKKLRNQQGETLVEVLAAILIAALSVALLFSCIAASSKMDKMTRNADKVYYNAFSDAEEQKNPLPDTAKIKVENGTKNTEISVNLYGDDGLYSYKKEEP